MPEHPTLRIHSPRPDIQVVANQRKQFWLLERTTRRLGSLMVTFALFFCISGFIMGEWWLMSLFVLGCLFLAVSCLGASEKFQEMSATTPTRDDGGFAV